MKVTNVFFLMHLITLEFHHRCLYVEPSPVWYEVMQIVHVAIPISVFPEPPAARTILIIVVAGSSEVAVTTPSRYSSLPALKCCVVGIPSQPIIHSTDITAQFQFVLCCFTFYFEDLVRKVVLDAIIVC